MTEKRTHERVPFTARVSVFFKGKRIDSDADTRNISLKGMFVHTDERPGTGAHCGLELALTGASSELTLHIDGRVVREDDNGIGIVFNTIDLDSYYHLKNILRYNASNPDGATDPLSGEADEVPPQGKPSWEDIQSS